MRERPSELDGSCTVETVTIEGEKGKRAMQKWDRHSDSSVPTLPFDAQLECIMEAWPAALLAKAPVPGHAFVHQKSCQARSV